MEARVAHPSFIERYFTRYVSREDHLYYNQHSNGLIVGGMLHSHPALLAKPTGLRFLVSKSSHGEATGDLDKLVSGKRKRGGIQVVPQQRICEVESQGQRFIVRSLIKATIIELNEQLLGGDLTTLESDPEESGFIFIAMPVKDNQPLDEAAKGLVKVSGPARPPNPQPELF